MSERFIKKLSPNQCYNPLLPFDRRTMGQAFEIIASGKEIIHHGNAIRAIAQDKGSLIINGDITELGIARNNSRLKVTGQVKDLEVFFKSFAKASKVSDSIIALRGGMFSALGCPNLVSLSEGSTGVIIGNPTKIQTKSDSICICLGEPEEIFNSNSEIVVISLNADYEPSKVTGSTDNVSVITQNQNKQRNHLSVELQAELSKTVKFALSHEPVALEKSLAYMALLRQANIL